MNGITRKQRDEIVRRVRAGMSFPAEYSALYAYLDSLVAEPEQPKPTVVTETIYVDVADEDRLHADDARAAMAALIVEPAWPGDTHSALSIITGADTAGRSYAGDVAFCAHELADAMQAERKRRQG